MVINKLELRNVFFKSCQHLFLFRLRNIDEYRDEYEDDKEELDYYLENGQTIPEYDKQAYINAIDVISKYMCT